MKKLILIALVAALSVSVAQAQTIAEEIATADILAFTGDTDTDPEALAVSADGNFIYVFEDDGGNAVTDGIWRYDAGGTTFTVYLTEAGAVAVENGHPSTRGAGSQSAYSLTTDPAGNVYINVRFGGDNWIFRGNADGSTVEVLATADVVDGAGPIDYDATDDTLLVYIESGFADSGIGGIMELPNASTGTSVTGTFIVTDAQIAAALDDDASGSGTVADVGLSDIVVLSDGRIVGVNGFPDVEGLGFDGDMIISSADGVTVTPFENGADIATQVGSAAAPIDFDFTLLEVNDSDQIFIFTEGGNASEDYFILRIDADGTGLITVNTLADLTAALGGTFHGAFNQAVLQCQLSSARSTLNKKLIAT
jgi:hypothetical protein